MSAALWHLIHFAKGYLFGGSGKYAEKTYESNGHSLKLCGHETRLETHQNMFSHCFTLLTRLLHESW